LLSACAASSSAPLERIELPFRPGRKVDRLLIVVHDEWQSFEKNGFIDELAERAIELDVISVGSKRPDFAERFHDDLILPKRREGYRKIWVAGISRGGLGAISFARRYANEPDGLILIAPYLGPDPLVDEINAQGGLDRWRPKPPVDELEAAWQWLQGYGLEAPRPPIQLLSGEQDRSSVQITTVEEVLPEGSVHRLPGGHDWKTWRRLWADLVERDPFGWVSAR
jgi:pimeloyl-ACP methyl ester carboxylesterase